MSQLSYSNEMELGVEGQKADLSNVDVLSRAAEGSVPVGRVVVIGTDKDVQCKLPTVSTDITAQGKALGVAMLDSRALNGQTSYANKEAVSVAHKGRVFVKPEEVMDPTSTPYVRFKGKKQVQTIVWDADFVASNTINGKVGGVAISQVTYATSHAATIAAVATAIAAANTKVLSATASSRTITVVSDWDQELELSDWVVAAGSSQADETITQTQARVLTTDVGKIRATVDNDEGSAATAAALPKSRILKSNESVGDLAVLEIDL